MNLHWGKTLENKWVKLRSKPYINYSLPLTYNVTEIRLLSQKYYSWEASNYSEYDNNQTWHHSQNQFLKKSRILTDMFTAKAQPHSFTTVVVLASIFLFVTLSITAAVVVFCRKRNSVFALQKSEQEEEGELELDDLPTDFEYTETEIESDPERSVSGHVPSEEEEGSPARRPLVTAGQRQLDSELEEIQPGKCHRCGADARGSYQRLVVAAVLEKPLLAGLQAEEGNCDGYLHKLHQHYYGIAAVPSDNDSDHDIGPYTALPQPPPIINVTYVDEPPSYDSIHHQHQVTVDIEPPPLTERTSHTSGHNPRTSMSYHDKFVYVGLPQKDSKGPLDSSQVVFVELPPKPPTSLPHVEAPVEQHRPQRSRSQGDLPSSNVLSVVSQGEWLPPCPPIQTTDACTSPIQPELPALIPTHMDSTQREENDNGWSLLTLNFNDAMQECSIPSVLAMEIPQLCFKPWIWYKRTLKSKVICRESLCSHESIWHKFLHNIQNRLPTANVCE